MFRSSGLLLTGALMLSFQTATAQDGIALDTPEKRFSYAIGQNVGNNIKGDLEAAGFDAEVFISAVRDVFGDGGRLNDQEMQAAFGELQVAQDTLAQAGAGQVLAENEAYLTAKAAEAGIEATDSGLLYKVVTAGAGAKPTSTDTVTVHYTGKLTNGKVFDSSVQRGQPAQFPVNRVIPGWTEALQLMPVGSTWEVWIPSQLGYGAQGAGNDIPPHAVLNFTIELIDIAG